MLAEKGYIGLRISSVLEKRCNDMEIGRLNRHIDGCASPPMIHNILGVGLSSSIAFFSHS